jgi:hypothetical protein
MLSLLAPRKKMGKEVSSNVVFEEQTTGMRDFSTLSHFSLVPAKPIRVYDALSPDVRLPIYL